MHISHLWNKLQLTIRRNLSDNLNISDFISWLLLYLHHQLIKSSKATWLERKRNKKLKTILKQTEKNLKRSWDSFSLLTRRFTSKRYNKKVLPCLIAMLTRNCQNILHKKKVSKTKLTRIPLSSKPHLSLPQ